MIHAHVLLRSFRLPFLRPLSTTRQCPAGRTEERNRLRLEKEVERLEHDKEKITKDAEHERRSLQDVLFLSRTCFLLAGEGLVHHAPLAARPSCFLMYCPLPAVLLLANRDLWCMPFAPHNSYRCAHPPFPALFPCAMQEIERAAKEKEAAIAKAQELQVEVFAHRQSTAGTIGEQRKMMAELAVRARYSRKCRFIPPPPLPPDRPTALDVANRGDWELRPSLSLRPFICLIMPLLPPP